jgi:hypothetical protein
VKGHGNDPLIAVVDRHAHRGEVNGLAYDSKLYGVVGGIDYTSKPKNGEQSDDGEAHY